MNERATRMLFAAAALSAFAALLASTANAQASVGEKLGEIGAWAVPSTSHEELRLLQRASVGERLGEIGAWAVPSTSHDEPQLLQRASAGKKLGKVGARAARYLNQGIGVPN